MNWTTIQRFICSGMVVGLSSASAASAEPALTDVAVFPHTVQLTGALDRQSIVVQANYSDGLTRDVTDRAKYRIEGGGVVRLKKTVLHPVADGNAKLAVAFAGRKLIVPITVRDAKTVPPASFKLDVMPVFMKAGCNSGSCHGSSRGQNGFRLSVFGFDPDGDHYRLTREFIGRRVNLAVPEESLILEKPTEQVGHGGGERFTKESEHYATLLRWLKAGTPQDSADVAQPVSVNIFPKYACLNNTSAQRFTVRAKYSDGTDRDVTSLTVFSSSNGSAATVSDDGVVTSGNRGESFITARFDSFTVGVPIIVVPKGQPFQFPNAQQHNYIDSLVDKKLKKLRVAPSEICSDEVFLRRVYSDMIGLLPTPQEYRNFLASTDARKREKLVDALLQRPEFTDIWVMKWAELLQIHHIKGGFFQWLAKRFNQNVPMDQIVRELLTAEGGFFRDPPVQYFRYSNDPPKMAENLAQVFMGTRIQCARCHNHPFDRWTMDDYYSFAAFFAQLGSKRSWEDTREKIVFDKKSGEVRHPNDNRVMPPKFLAGVLPKIAGQDRRAVLAEWLTAPENPYFAANLANLAWAQFFGQGIVDPVDDFRVSNPPSNPELLDALARKLVECNYDFRKLIRDICVSRTYQLSTKTNPSNQMDQRNFSHASYRRLRAEILHDCICQATDSPSRLGGFPLGTRAVQLPVASMTNYFLKTFGRTTRGTVCSCEVDVEPNLSQALNLINGETTWGKIEKGQVIPRLINAGRTPREIVEALFIRCLTRKPTPDEVTHLTAFLNASEDKQQVLEELFWALLNSKEFLFNH